MDNTVFNTYIIVDGKYINVEVRPCCGENNIVDYAIWINGKLEFTITKDETTDKWVIAMKNADDEIDDITVMQVGIEIDKRNKR